MAQHLMEILSVPATTTRGEIEVAQIREQRAQMQQEMMQQQQLMAEAEAAGKAAPALRMLEGGAE